MEQPFEVARVLGAVMPPRSDEDGDMPAWRRDIAPDVIGEDPRLIQVLPLPIEAGEHYGEIRAALQRSGQPIGNNDLWIAAHARALGIPVVTNNTGEFARVSGLTVEDWTQA